MKWVSRAVGVLLGLFFLFGMLGYLGVFGDSEVDFTVTSDPTGARVLINGFEVGTTPGVFKVTKNKPFTYRVLAKEPYEYNLYKPFFGGFTLEEDNAVSVWLERTSIEEQQAQITQIEEAAKKQAEAQEQARLERERQAELNRQRAEAEAEARRLYYRIETNCGSGVDITISNADGNTQQWSNQGNGWYYYFVPTSGQFIYISAQNQCDYGYVTVKLVQNEITIKENTSTGAYVIADISGRW